MMLIDLKYLDNNPFQPRLGMERIEELAEDILAKREMYPETLGLMQLPQARPAGEGRYQLVFGHRRREAFAWLAVQNPVYQALPVEVVALSDHEMAQAAWAENVVRDDISAVEQARFIARAMDEFGWTHKMASRAFGIPEGTLSNLLRLLALPAQAQEMIQRGELSASHGKALASLVNRGQEDRVLAMLDEAKTLSSTQLYARIAKEARPGRGHGQVEKGDDLEGRVVAPTARALEEALADRHTGAWRQLLAGLTTAARAELEDDDGLMSAVAEELARRLIRRQSTVRGARLAVNQAFERMGLPSPWNQAAMEKVGQFLAYRKGKRGTRNEERGTMNAECGVILLG